MKKEAIFKTNPDKAASRVAINSFMMAGVITIITLIWTLKPENFSIFLIAQLILAVPLLFVSSLAYSKIGYWKETKLWDALGWYTNNIGNLFILNVFGIIASIFSMALALFYFATFIILMVIYSIINIIYNPASLKEKTFKFLFLVLIIFLGGIGPLYFF